MVINITQQHIDRAGRCSTNCPGAQALNDILPPGVYPVVMRSAVRIKQMGSGKVLHKYKSPKALVDFTTYYDHDQLVTPTSFELPIDELLNG